MIRRDRSVWNDVANQVRHNEVRCGEYDAAWILVSERIVPMDTRYVARYELQLLLERVGFELVDVF